MKRISQLMVIGLITLTAAISVPLTEGAKTADHTPITWPYVSEKISPVEKLSVDSPTGFKVPVMLRKPPGDGPFPLIMVVHGGTATYPIAKLHESVTGKHNVVRLLAAGYAIAAPTFSPRQEDPQTTAALRDCLAALEHVRKLPGIDSSSVFIFGGSGGGSLALELAGEAKLNAIAAGEPATVLFTGAWNKQTIGELNAIMADPLKYCDNEKIRSFTRAKIEKIACPTLIVHSDVHAINKINDVFVIPMMKEAGKTPEIRTVPGVRHGFYFASTQNPRATLEAFESIAAFFSRYTKTSPSPIDPAKLQLRDASKGGADEDDTPRPAAVHPAASSEAAALDWDKIRQLHTRVKAGEKLSPEDQAYYDKGAANWNHRPKGK